MTLSSAVIKCNFYMMSSKGYLIYTHNADESQNNYAECKKLVKNTPKRVTLYNSIYVKCKVIYSHRKQING